jgi:hypothetical protein
MFTIERPKVLEKVSSKKFSNVDRQIIKAGFQLLACQNLHSDREKSLGFGPKSGITNDQVAVMMEVLDDENNWPKSFSQKELYILGCAVLELKTYHIVYELKDREPTEAEVLGYNLADNLSARIAIMRGFDNKNTRRALKHTSKLPFLKALVPSQLAS